jgi:hypothetical protein
MAQDDPDVDVTETEEIDSECNNSGLKAESPP